MDLSILSFMAFKQIWNNAQSPMSEIVRWSNFPDYGQTLVEHSNSVPLVGLWVMSHFSTETEINQMLVLTALMVHDHGEPLANGDSVYEEKKPTDDLYEWTAFRDIVSDQSLQPFSVVIEEAFLLQFCRNSEIDLFNESTKRRIQGLQEEYPLEAAVFEFVERIDYFLSASAGREAGIRNQEEEMMEHTFKNQAHKLDALVEEFPILGSVWTPGLKSWLQGE